MDDAQIITDFIASKHEAGHLVVAYLLGWPVEDALRRKHGSGEVKLTPPQSDGTTEDTRRIAIETLIVKLAGPMEVPRLVPVTWPKCGNWLGLVRISGKRSAVLTRCGRRDATGELRDRAIRALEQNPRLDALNVFLALNPDLKSAAS